MALIPQETIDQIRDTADILDIVSDYVDLKRRGRNFFGLCPFHAEKTPSFSVAPEKQIFHCFGCGKGGNVISFVMEYEKIEFVDAVRQLGKRYGVEIKAEQGDRSNKIFTLLYDIHELAVEHYEGNLHSKKGTKALEYLSERGFSEETVRKFRLGFASDEWDTLLTKVKGANFPMEVLDKSGLFAKSSKGRFDRFRNRILFPIVNLSGRTVAFGGRDFSGESDAKYLNSPETPIYNKSDILFGLEITRDFIRKERSIVILEGYTDFLQLFQHGISNIVATSGTALTNGHVNQIRRFADSAHLVYDGDEAGRKAAIRAGYTLTRGGVKPSLVELPDETDPDSWIREIGKEAFEKAIYDGIDVLDFHIIHSGYDLNKPADRSNLAQDISVELAGIKDPIIQQHTIRRVSNLLTVEDNVLINMIKRRSRRQRDQTNPDDYNSTNFSSPADKAQLELIRLLAMGDEAILSPLKEHISTDHFNHPILRKLADQLMIDEKMNFSQLLENFEETEHRNLVSKILFEAENHTTTFQATVDCIITLEKAPLKEQISEQRIKLRKLEQKGDDASHLLKEVISLQSKLNSLNNRRDELLNLEP